MIEFIKTSNHIVLLKHILPFLTTEDSQAKATLYLVNSIEDILGNIDGRNALGSFHSSDILGEFDYFSTLFSDNKFGNDILTTLSKKIDEYNSSHSLTAEKDISLMNKTERDNFFHKVSLSTSITGSYEDFMRRISMSIDAQKSIESFLVYTDDEKILKIKELLNNNENGGTYFQKKFNDNDYTWYYPNTDFTLLKCMHLAKTLSSDEAKKTVIELFFSYDFPASVCYLTELAKTLDNDTTKFNVITECFDADSGNEACAFAIAKTLKSDEYKLKVISQRLVIDFDIALVLALETDEAKLKALDILDYLCEEPYDFDFVTIVRTLKTDNSRLQSMKLAKDYFSDSDNYSDIQFEIASTLTSTDAIIKASEIVDNKDLQDRILSLTHTDNSNCTTEDDLRRNYQNCNTSQIPGAECLLPSEKANSIT